MFSGRQFREFFEVLRAQRIGNSVLFTEPFAEVNQLATARAKWPVGAGEPIAYPLASRTLNIHSPRHYFAAAGLISSVTVFRSAATAADLSAEAPPVVKMDSTSLIIASF